MALRLKFENAFTRAATAEVKIVSVGGLTKTEELSCRLEGHLIAAADICEYTILGEGTSARSSKPSAAL